MLPLVLAAVLAAVWPENKLFHVMQATRADLELWYPRFALLAFVMLRGAVPLLAAFWTAAVMARFRMLPVPWLWPVLVLSGQLALILVEGLRPALLATTLLLAAFYGRARWLAIVDWGMRPANIKVAHLPLMVILILAASVRIALVYLTDNSSEPDAACRILIAHIWSDYYLADGDLTHILNPNADWPPLHFYLSGLLLKAGLSIESVRLFHAMVGVLNGWILFRVARMFSSATVALLVSATYLVYPASMVVSAQIMSEPLFLFTVLGSLHAFLRFRESKATLHLFAMVLWINAAALLRYEGWTLCVIYPVLYLVTARPIKLSHLLTFSLALLAPLVICGLLMAQGFHPLRGILYSDEQVAYCFTQSGRHLSVFLQGYRAAWVPMALGTFIISAIMFRRNGNFRTYAAFVGLFLLPFVLKNATFGLFPQYRYLTYYMVLMMVPMSMLSVLIVEKVLVPRPFALAVLLVPLLMSVSGGRFVSSGLLHFPRGFEGSLKAVQQLPTGQFHLDHHAGVGVYHWIVETRMPILLDYEDTYLSQHIDFEVMKRVAEQNGTTRKAIRFMVNDYESEFGTTDFERLHRLLADGGENYLVLFPDKPLSKHFRLSGPVEEREGLRFEQVFSENGYLIYRVTVAE